MLEGKDFLDFGAPEYFVTDVALIEPVRGSDCLRLYAVADRSRGERVLQYTVIVPRHRLEAMLRKVDDATREPPTLFELDFAVAN